MTTEELIKRLEKYPGKEVIIYAGRYIDYFDTCTTLNDDNTVKAICIMEMYKE